MRKKGNAFEDAEASLSYGFLHFNRRARAPPTGLDMSYERDIVLATPGKKEALMLFGNSDHQLFLIDAIP